MNLSSELYISHSQKKEGKAFQSSSISAARDSRLSIYEKIEKVLNEKPSINMDLDIHLMLNKLI